MKEITVILATTLITGEVLAGLVWMMVRVARKTEEDSHSFITKMVVTLSVIGLLICVVLFIVRGMAQGDKSAAYLGVPLLAACGLVLAILWGRNLGNLFASSLRSAPRF